MGNIERLQKTRVNHNDKESRGEDRALLYATTYRESGGDIVTDLDGAFRVRVPVVEERDASIYHLCQV